MNTATENMVGKLLEPVFQTLPANVARQIVDLEADEAFQQRVEFLARKSNEGELTPQERDEYDAYVQAGDVLGILQALARRTLQHAPS
ncbi:MAG TPA: hypothetical protein VHC19_11670 [Pirellulales bacterium]|jgi:hypothetical protein|nr:hypothetical protein [Pirellulales bacterium]